MRGYGKHSFTAEPFNIDFVPSKISLLSDFDSSNVILLRPISHTHTAESPRRKALFDIAQ